MDPLTIAIIITTALVVGLIAVLTAISIHIRRAEKRARANRSSQ